MTLILVTDEGPDLIPRVYDAVAGGVDRVIVRERDLSDSDYVTCIESLLPCGASLIVHGRAHVAQQMNLPLHMPFDMAHDATVPCSVSVHDVMQWQSIASRPVLSVLIGNVFETSCKPGKPAMGMLDACALCHTVSVPAFAIGGILPEHVDALLDGGFSGVAIRSGILSHANPAHAAAQYKHPMCVYR